MSKEIDEIRYKLRENFGNDNDTVFQGVVTAVNEDEFTCDVRRDNAVDYFDVRLRGLVKADLQGFAFIPKLDSLVLVCRINNSNELFVCQFTEIDKVIFTDNDFELKIDLDNIDLKKGEKITVHIDAKKIEIVNDKTKITQEAEALTLSSDQATVKITTGGLTLKKGSSGLKKTLNDLLTAIQALTVPTGVGPSGPPINIADFAKVQQDLPNYMEG
ncbi:hypothetical protein EZS27_012237 [termite gut metagenome]|jgi:hypothetical protein|uniref:Uncharacterized protein n=1 Tax=termite gut metagenome TaxID=433724 RepID=A0A5J4S2D5_9ZZZZ